jgi:hypothetical protein
MIITLHFLRSNKACALRRRRRDLERHLGRRAGWGDGLTLEDWATLWNPKTRLFSASAADLAWAMCLLDEQRLARVVADVLEATRPKDPAVEAQSVIPFLRGEPLGNLEPPDIYKLYGIQRHAQEVLRDKWLIPWYSACRAALYAMGRSPRQAACCVAEARKAKLGLNLRALVLASWAKHAPTSPAPAAGEDPVAAAAEEART